VIARAQVEAERQLYLDLFESAPDGYLVTDEVGTEKPTAPLLLLNVSQRFLIRQTADYLHLL